ncbi:hypothetical protein AB0E88_00445 [Streptomyces sp. NPDC028635]
MTESPPPRASEPVRARARRAPHLAPTGRRRTSGAPVAATAAHPPARGM